MTTEELKINKQLLKEISKRKKEKQQLMGYSVASMSQEEPIYNEI